MTTTAAPADSRPPADPAHPPGSDIPAGTRLRSGTAARLAGVPVATLRVWERRYGVVAAPKSATGQRHYSAHDVQRLRLLRQLTEHGHAIGTLAVLGLQPLQALWANEAPAAPGQAARQGPLRVVLVGRGAEHKLAAAPGCEVQAAFDDLAAVAGVPAPVVGCERLLLNLPSLQPLVAEQVLALVTRWQAEVTVVLYAFGAETVAEGLRAAGVLVRRDPISANELARLLAGAGRVRPGAPVVPAQVPDDRGAPARQFSDDQLAALIEMPTPVACECPRHLAEMVLQLAGFERYSTDCQSRSPADAALHRQLSQLAGNARSSFEQALQRVMAAEGLVLPAAVSRPVIHQISGQNR